MIIVVCEQYQSIVTFWRTTFFQNKTILLHYLDQVFRSRIAEERERDLHIAISKQVLRRGPSHWAKDQQDRATHECLEVCVYAYGRWVRFMSGHDKEKRGSPSIQVSHPIRQVHPPCRRAMKLSIGAKYCIPTVTSLPRGASLFPVLRVPPSSIISILGGFAVGASQYYGRWTLNVDS